MSASRKTPVSRRQPKPLPLTAQNPELLVDGSDQTLRRLTLGFAVLGWELAEIRADFGKLVHTSPFQYVALQAIARVEAEEPWTARSLARHFRVTNAFVSMELRALLKKNLVQAQPDPNDGRAKLLSLTPEGVKALTGIAPVQQKVNDLLYAQFDSAALVQQCRVVERMAADAAQALAFLRGVLDARTFKT